MLQLEFKSKQSDFRAYATKLYDILFIIVHSTVQIQVHIRIKILHCLLFQNIFLTEKSIFHCLFHELQWSLSYVLFNIQDQVLSVQSTRASPFSWLNLTKSHSFIHPSTAQLQRASYIILYSILSNIWRHLSYLPFASSFWV